MIGRAPWSATTNSSPSGRTSHLPHLPSFSGLAYFALVQPGPDVDAFTGGVITAISAGFIVLAVFGGLAIVRRILGS